MHVIGTQWSNLQSSVFYFNEIHKACIQESVIRNLLAIMEKGNISFNYFDKINAGER